MSLDKASLKDLAERANKEVIPDKRISLLLELIKAESFYFVHFIFEFTILILKFVKKKCSWMKKT